MIRLVMMRRSALRTVRRRPSARRPCFAAGAGCLSLEFPALCTVLLDWEEVKTATDVNVVVVDIFLGGRVGDSGYALKLRINSGLQVQNDKSPGQQAE
jgi:hypothetical protein